MNMATRAALGMLDADSNELMAALRQYERHFRAICSLCVCVSERKLSAITFHDVRTRIGTPKSHVHGARINIHLPRMWYTFGA